MSRRLLFFLLSLVLVSFFSTSSFTQETKAVEEKKADETAKPVQPDIVIKADEADKKIESVTVVGEPDSIKYTAKEPIIYFDGYNTFINTRVAYKLSASDDIEKNRLYYKIDEGAEKQYTKPFTLGQEGKHVISYHSTDRMEQKGNGNVFTVILDNSAPVTTLFSNRPVVKKDSTLFTAPSAVFSIKAEDQYSGVSSLVYTLNENEMKPYASSFALPADKKETAVKITSTDNVSITTKKFTLKAVDQQGADVAVSDSVVTLTTDSTAPEVAISANREIVKKDDRNIVAKDYLFSINAKDSESGVSEVMIRLDDEKTFRKYSEAFSFNTHGNHTIEAKAVDKVGNISNSVALTVFVDIAPPSTDLKPYVEEAAGSK
jgi:hypothetical protein